MLKKLKSLKLPKLNLPQSIKLPKFSKSSESTTFSDLDLSESQQPTESIKSIKSFSFDRKKAAKAASSVVLFGFSGWVLWNTFLVEPESTLPPSALPAVATMNPAPIAQPLTPVEPIETEEPLAATDPDLMIDELLVATSEDKQTNDMPDQWLQGIQHSPNTSHDQDTLIEAEQLMAEVFETTLYEEASVDDASPETITAMDALTPETEKHHQYALTTRSNLDARDCLNLTENMDIHRCADNYR